MHMYCTVGIATLSSRIASLIAHVLVSGRLLDGTKSNALLLFYILLFDPGSNRLITGYSKTLKLGNRGKFKCVWVVHGKCAPFVLQSCSIFLF